MPKLSKLHSKPKEVEIPLEGDEPLKLMVATYKITPALLSKLESADTEDTNKMVVFLSALLLSWNLTDDKGKVIALNKESLSELPVEVLSRIITAINESQSPN